jgi:hypothetical protein
MIGQMPGSFRNWKRQEMMEIEWKDMGKIIPEKIQIRGARVHNLKNIDVDIPLNRIVGIAGSPDQENPRSRWAYCTRRVPEDTWNLFLHIPEGE